MSFSGTKGYQTKPKPGVMLNPLHPLSRGLAGCWLFNESAGSLTNDISGNGNHGILTNMLPNTQGSGWTGSEFGGGLQYDGVNDYVNCGNDLSLDITNDITIFAEINTNTITGGLDHIVTKRLDNTHVNYAFENDTGKIKFYYYNSGWHRYASNDVVLIAGQKYDVVFEYSSGNASSAKISINGAEVVGNWDLGTGAASLVSDSSNLLIGATRSSDPIEFFDGFIGLISIYNRILSTEEIKTLHSNQFCNLLQVPIRRYSVDIAPPPVSAYAGLMMQMIRQN